MNGYQEIKDLISDIDEFHNEAELREILQQILFICEEELKPIDYNKVMKNVANFFENATKKEPSTDNQIEKQMIHKNIYKNTFFIYFITESKKGQEKC